MYFLHKRPDAGNQKTEGCRKPENCRKLQSRPRKLADTFWNQAEPQASLLQQKLEQTESNCLSDALPDVIEVAASKEAGLKTLYGLWPLTGQARMGKPPVTAVTKSFPSG